MPKEIEYYDSQASAAASLGLDIYKIREAKTQGCSAFRSGRVYRAPLLEWFAKKRKRLASSSSISPHTASIGKAMEALANAYEAEAITHELFFDQTTALVEATGNKEILAGWIQFQFDWLAENFPNPAEAWKVHPKVVEWLHDLAGLRGQDS
jgi:hypothetical protein